MSFHLGKPRLPSVEYYPNNIGNLTIGSPRSYAFLVYGRDEKGIQVQVLNTLLKRGARIVSQNGYSEEKNREFTLCISCDLGEANVTPDDIVIELRRMKPIKNAMAIHLKNRMFDGFLFPLTILLSNRVISIDSNITFLIQERLDSEESKIGLRDVGRNYVLDVVKQVREKMSTNFQEETIQENVRGYLKAAGWGSFSWESERTFERVVVIDSPIYSGKAVGNYFLHGMAAGLVESFRKKKFALAEEVYNQEKRSLTLLLSEVRIEAKRPEAEKKITKSVEIKALEEVEKVIRSVELDEMEIDIAPVSREEPKPVVLVQQSGKEEKLQLTAGKVVSAVASVPVVNAVAEVSSAPTESTKTSEPLIEVTVLPIEVRSPPITEAPKQEIKPILQPEPTKEIKAPIVEPPKEIKAPIVEPPKEQVRPTMQVEPPKEEIRSTQEEKKPLRVIEIKGIKEKEEDDEDEEDSNELWFEQAVQE